jgi:hypothetical protein
MSSDEEEKAAKTKKSCPRLHDIMMVRCYDVDMLVELMNYWKYSPFTKRRLIIEGEEGASVSTSWAGEEGASVSTSWARLADFFETASQSAYLSFSGSTSFDGTEQKWQTPPQYFSKHSIFFSGSIVLCNTA